MTIAATLTKTLTTMLMTTTILIKMAPIVETIMRTKITSAETISKVLGMWRIIRRTLILGWRNFIFPQIPLLEWHLQGMISRILPLILIKYVLIFWCLLWSESLYTLQGHSHQILPEDSSDFPHPLIFMTSQGYLPHSLSLTHGSSPCATTHHWQPSSSHIAPDRRLLGHIGSQTGRKPSLCPIRCNRLQDSECHNNTTHPYCQSSHSTLSLLSYSAGSSQLLSISFETLPQSQALSCHPEAA